MPRGGKQSPPGGRPKGSKNKATIERELLANLARENAGRSTDERKKLAVDTLETLMNLAMGKVALHQPIPHDFTEEMRKGRLPNDDLFERWMTKAGGFARDLAPYQSPTFKAVAVMGTNDPAAANAFVRFILEGAPPMEPGPKLVIEAPK